jgi:RHS repeat-associated protein
MQNIDDSKYIFLWSTKVASVENGEIIYHHEDHLGGGNIDISSTWALLQVIDYLPFWEIRTKNNYTDYENKYVFWWKEQDSESELQYFEARCYDNNIARFHSIDRVFWEIWDTERANIGLMDPQRFNSYSYAWNNPLVRSDSTWEWWDIAVDSLVAAWWIWYWKVSWNEYLVIWAQNMLKDSLKPQNALNPFKKIQKVQKWLNAGKKLGWKIKYGSQWWPWSGKAFSKGTKQKAYGESKGKCVNCGITTNQNKISNPKKSEIDHAIPKSRWGNNTIDNAQNMCRTCNRTKWASTSSEFKKKQK